MIKIRLLALAGGFLAFFATDLFAGELKLDIESFPLLQTAIEPKMKAEDLKLQKNTEGTWNFQMASATTVFGELTISIDPPVSGYDAFAMTVDVPYFWDSSWPRKIAAALVDDDVSDAGVRVFYSNIGAGPTAIPDIVLYHERARRLWIERARQLADHERWAPNEDDVRIAYWVVRTMGDLVESQFIEVDPSSRQAENWLKATLSDDAEAARLFNTQTVSKETAQALFDELDSRDSIVYNKVVQKLEEDMRTGEPSACSRITALNSLFDEMGDDERKNYDGKFSNSLKVANDLLVCKAKEAQNLRATGVGISETQRSRFEAVIESAQDAISQPSNSDRNSRIQRATAFRILEMRELVQ